MICQRCAKDRDGIHTCTPSDLVRKLEQQRDELLAALESLEKDNHTYQTRPCPTCRKITSTLGRPFGCNAKERNAAPKPVAHAWQPTNEELTTIYMKANGIEGKNPPITTERIFTAMRAMLAAAPKPENGHE